MCRAGQRSCHAIWSSSSGVAEVNYGGAMVEATIRAIDPSAVTASRGKVARAKPVAALYEQARVHHHGSFPELEDQMA